ncbi:GNAT family N-acetyltransferase [Inquilinus limosus]|uniref:GNAT family N-acetyltransferase n=1 Tax=Inquilinus limosus TaxID=171674 RepID=UPI003F192713
MYVNLINNLPDFVKSRDQWDAVYDADPEAQFFLSWTFLSGWLGDASGWFILCVKPNADPSSSPVAFFPLKYRMSRTQDGNIRKEISTACNRLADYTGFICVPEFQENAIYAFAKALKHLDWDDLHLENILASNDRIRMLLRLLSSEDFETKHIKIMNKRDNVDNYVCPYVDLPAQWEDYLSSLRPNTRSKIRRFLRKLDGFGGFQITHSDHDTIDRDLDILLRFWKSKWADRKGDRIDSIVEIQRRMLTHCFKSGSLFLPVLWKQGIPLGALASIIDTKNRSLLFYVGSRDETVSSPPPGFVLHSHSIRYAIDNGFKSYDFLRGNEPYKYLFGARERHIRYIVVSARNRQSLPKRVDGGGPLVRSSTEGELTRWLLRPSAQEQAAHVLFLARHALDSSTERKAKYGYHVTYHEVLLKTIRGLGFRVTPASEHQVLFGPLDFDFLYAIHSHAVFDGHELLAPAIAAFRGVPCLGSSAPTRAISEDKVLAKQVAASLGLVVAKHRIISQGLPDMGESSPSGSWVLKPRGGIASEALAKVDTESDWRRALEIISDPRNGGRDFILEEFVPGINITVPVVEGFPPCSLAAFEERGRPGDNIVTHEGKRGLDHSYSSAPYNGPGARQALEAAARMAAEISPFDYARFDFRYDPDSDRLVFIEVNIACNMSPASVIYRAAALHGIQYEELVGHVLTYSLKRQRKQMAREMEEALA